MRNLWPTESEVKLKRRKPKSRKKRKNKANSSSTNLVIDNLDNDLNNELDNLDNLDNEADDTQLLDAYENWNENQNYYEVEINQEQYEYMLEHNYINDQNECIRLEFPGKKEDDPSIRNVLFEEQQQQLLLAEEEEEQRKKKEKNKSSWWLNDEEFDENFELTYEQKLKCLAFFIWIITLIIFFYFHTPDNKNDHHSENSNGHHARSLDRIKEMTRNRFPGFPVSNFDK